MLTEIAFVLDRSGSMESIRRAAIDGFNDFLRDQQAAPGQTRLTLVFFDTVIETRHEALPVADVCPLTAHTYIPDGATALLDAIGDTIDRFGRRFAAVPAEERPGHVAIAILTDGEENSSQRYSWQDIASRIDHQKEKYSWDFFFLGAGADAIATASRMNIGRDFSASYAPDAAGHSAASKSVSRKFSSVRAVKSGCANEAEIADASAPLDHLVREEDAKNRIKR